MFPQFRFFSPSLPSAVYLSRLLFTCSSSPFLLLPWPTYLPPPGPQLQTPPQRAASISTASEASAAHPSFIRQRRYSAAQTFDMPTGAASPSPCATRQCFCLPCFPLPVCVSVSPRHSPLRNCTPTDLLATAAVDSCESAALVLLMCSYRPLANSRTASRARMCSAGCRERLCMMLAAAAAYHFRLADSARG